MEPEGTVSLGQNNVYATFTHLLRLPLLYRISPIPKTTSSPGGIRRTMDSIVESVWQRKFGVGERQMLLMSGNCYNVLQSIPRRMVDFQMIDK